VTSKMSGPTTATRRSPIGRILRSPLLHFTVIGTLLYSVFSDSNLESERVIRVGRSDIATLESDWQRRSARAPNQAELALAIDQFVDEALLVRVARDLGWDRDDTVIRQRLIRNWRFLDPESQESDSAVLRKAYAIGMDRSDIVVKRRLLERMNLMLAARVREAPPTDGELEAYLQEHADEFMRPERLRITQIYLSRDRRGISAFEDAEALGAQLRQSNTMPEIAESRGDPFLIHPALPLWSQRQIADRLGGNFAEQVAQQPLNEWSAPISSSYGEHIVWLHEREPAHLPSLSLVRKAVEGSIYREREAELRRLTIDSLRKEFGIEIANSDQSP
jgi:hypothetical protein